MGQIRALGTVNVGAVEEYAETKARVDDLTAQQQDLKRAEMDLRELIERLLIQMRSTFVENFSKMQGYFAETFTRLFGGGHAELKLMDPDDPRSTPSRRERNCSSCRCSPAGNAR